MSLYYGDEQTTIWHGGCIEIMRTLADNSVDSIVTDPPYGLGFMGAKWDALPPGKDWAEECLRVLKPGGHLLAFGGSRTWHRLAIAIEDAGFEIRDSVFWLFGSGFPKHRAALKPACEPVVMARKPFKGSLTDNEAIHGTGALDIDGCRIGNGEGVVTFDREAGNRSRADYRTGTVTGGAKPSGAGRWPANVALDEHMAAVLDAQSGEAGGHAKPSGPKLTGGSTSASRGKFNGVAETPFYGDTGGASRFFYVAKAPKKERPVVDGVAHATVKPLALMRWLVRLVTPEGGTVLEPFAGSGTTVEACILEGLHCIAIEQEAEYLPLIQERIDRQEAA